MLLALPGMGGTGTDADEADSDGAEVLSASPTDTPTESARVAPGRAETLRSARVMPMPPQR
jgi:hypothetical protein